MNLMVWAKQAIEYMKDMGMDGKDIHIFPSSEEKKHRLSECCTCEPYVDFMDRDTGVSVYVHRRTQ